jgi:hypothetical protein
MSGLMEECDLALGSFRRKVSAKRAEVLAEHVGQILLWGGTHQT